MIILIIFYKTHSTDPHWLKNFELTSEIKDVQMHMFCHHFPPGSWPPVLRLAGSTLGHWGSTLMQREIHKPGLVGLTMLTVVRRRLRNPKVFKSKLQEKSQCSVERPPRLCHGMPKSKTLIDCSLTFRLH